MRRIGLLGGTFNPPHIGHLIMANEVYDALGLDEVRFMPNAIPPHKQTTHDATAEDRMRMTELSIASYEHFKIEPFEIESGGISYTYETMKRLTASEPDCEFYFIIGGDMIDMLDHWYKIDELMELVKFVGVNRPHSKAETTYPVQIIDAPLIELSSTLIRERVQSNRTITFLVPTEVEQFIREEGLYGTR